MIGIRISDPAEELIPNIGLIKVEDPETEEKIWVDISSKKDRDSHFTAIQNKWNNFYEECNRNQFDVIDVSTERDYVEPLMDFFRKREKRL